MMPEEEKKTTEESNVGSKDVDANKGIAAISYIWVLFIIPFLVKKDSKFAMFHAKQGLVLFIFTIIAGIVAWIPVIGWIISPIAWIVSVILFIIGILNALGGKTTPLPIIGKYAEKINV